LSSVLTERQHYDRGKAPGINLQIPLPFTAPIDHFRAALKRNSDACTYDSPKWSEHPFPDCESPIRAEGLNFDDFG
jgi:hypothetical protein